jgi:hypothetical protein
MKGFKMSKFEIGDKVEIVRFGKKGFVDKIVMGLFDFNRNIKYRYVISDDLGTYVERDLKLIERKEEMFTKSDLKDGMVVELRGDENFDSGYVVFNHIISGLNCWDSLDTYHDDLTHRNYEKFDIIKVYENNSCSSLKTTLGSVGGLKLIWGRKEPKEKTISVNEAMEQLEKIYKCKVKLEK